MSQILIPNDSKHDVATFSILIDEKEMNASYQVLAISIVKEINRVPTAKIILRDGDASERTFEISESNDFIPGKKISIQLGLDGNNKVAFKGIIVRHAIKVKEDGHGELHIECKDEAIKMTIGRHSRYYEKMKDKRVIEQLIADYKGLKSDVEDTKLEHAQLVQHHLSDWDFMLMRAEANGMLVNVDDGTVNVKPPKTNAAAALEVHYGSSVLEFEAEMDARNQWQNVKAYSWDFSNQQLFTANTSEASSFNQFGNLTGTSLSDTIGLKEYEMRHSGHVLERELQDWVDGIMLRSRLSKIRGRAKFTGFGQIKPGDMVTIGGVGARFKGKAFVTAVRQEMGAGMWDTNLQFGLDPMPYASIKNDLMDPANGGLLGSVHGLQIGKVVQLENDPDGQDRILVKLPLIDNKGKGIWTRMATLDAGDQRGSFFRPEIDDEVIVGFINGDPRDAVVLGMLHSSNKPAPITAKDVNHEKGFTTRSKMHIHFNDDTKTITIDTPAKNKIMLDEAGKKIEIIDQNNNKVVLEPSGITLDSPKNIDIKAGASLTINAKASLKVEAATISVKASGNLGLEGSLSKLSASGIAEISGSIVKIN